MTWFGPFVFDSTDTSQSLGKFVHLFLLPFETLLSQITCLKISHLRTGRVFFHENSHEALE